MHWTQSFFVCTEYWFENVLLSIFLTLYHVFSDVTSSSCITYMCSLAACWWEYDSFIEHALSTIHNSCPSTHRMHHNMFYVWRWVPGRYCSIFSLPGSCTLNLFSRISFEVFLHYALFQGATNCGHSSHFAAISIVILVSTLCSGLI